MWSKDDDPPVAELKCFNQNLTSSRIYSSAECARQFYTLADIQNYSWSQLKNIIKINEYRHIFSRFRKCWRLSCAVVMWRVSQLDSFCFLFQQFTKRVKMTFNRGGGSPRLKSWHKHQLMCVCVIYVFLKDLCNRTIHLLVDCGLNKTTSQYPNDGKHCERLFLEEKSNKQVNNIFSQQLP